MNAHLKEVKNKLLEKELDALFVLNIENSNIVTTHYLSGFTGAFAALLITQEREMIITDSNYWEQVKKESNFELVKYAPPKTFFGTILDLIRSLNIKKMGVEKDRISAGFFEALQSSVNVAFEDVSMLIFEIRAKKSSDEIEKIKVAVEIAEEAFKKMLEIIKPGMKEYEIATYLECQIKSMGFNVAFDSIVASGYQSALPVGKASDKIIDKGEPVIVDWGARYQGYNSDLTRVFCIGEPSDKVKHVHKIVYDAQQKAIEALKAGITGKEIDLIARNYIAENGYGEYFGHDLGHGIGLEVHENPALSFWYDRPLEEGHVVTVEPGIYLENEFGIRIEEDVVVRKDGCQILTTLTREIIIV